MFFFIFLNNYIILRYLSGWKRPIHTYDVANEDTTPQKTAKRILIRWILLHIYSDLHLLNCRSNKMVLKHQPCVWENASNSLLVESIHSWVSLPNDTPCLWQRFVPWAYRFGDETFIHWAMEVHHVLKKKSVEILRQIFNWNSYNDMYGWLP